MGNGDTSFSPRTTSLTIARYNNKKDSAEERFFAKLEQDVSQAGARTLQGPELQMRTWPFHTSSMHLGSTTSCTIWLLKLGPWCACDCLPCYATMATAEQGQGSQSTPIDHHTRPASM